MADILIVGGLVGTQDADRRVFAGGAIAIEGNRFVAVGPRAEVEAAHSAPTVIDASGKIVAPGFLCPHTHIPSVVGHNMPVDFKVQVVYGLADQVMVARHRGADDLRVHLLDDALGRGQDAQDRHYHRLRHGRSGQCGGRLPGQDGRGHRKTR